MKRVIIMAMALAFLVFLAFSCKSSKDNNIYINHAKEKNQFKTPADKKYNPNKRVE